MSNQAAMQYQIDLQNFIDLNKNKSTVRRFEGFTKRNSPYINNGISPLFSNKDIAADVITRKGESFKIEQVKNEAGSLINAWKLNVDNSPTFTYAIKKEEFINPAPSYKTLLAEENGEYDTWVSLQEGSVYLISPKTQQKRKIFEAGYYQYAYDIAIDKLGLWILYWNGQQTLNLRLMIPNLYSPEVVFTISSNKLINMYVIEFFYSDTWHYFYAWNEEENGGNVVKYFYYQSGVTPVIKTIPGYNYIDNKSDIYSLSARITSYTDYNTLTFNGKAAIGVNEQTNELITTYSELVSYKFNKTNNSVYAVSVGGIDTVKTVYDTIFLSWSIPVTLSNGETMYFYNMLPNGQIIDDDGNISSNLKVSVKNDRFNSRVYPFDLLFNNNYLSGISYDGVLLCNFLEVNTEDYFPVSRNHYEILYQNKDKNVIKVSLVTEAPKIEFLYDNYIIVKGICSDLEGEVVENAHTLNIYNIKTKEWSILGCDWNNRIIPDSKYIEFNLPDTTAQFMYIGSGHNISYENSKNSITSAQFGLALYRFYPLDLNDITSDNSLIKLSGVNYFNFFIDLYYNQDLTVIPSYIKSIKLIKRYSIYEPVEIIKVLPDYVGTTYPVQTEGNILLNPTIFDNFYISGLMYDSIKTPDDNFYKLIYSDAQPVLLYAYSSNIKDVTDIFFIQGQLYVIRNDVICSAIIDGNNFESITPVINKGALKFLGCTPLVAYFYSETDRHIYTFSGDRNLSKYLEISEFTEIKDSIYLPDNNSLLLATDNGLYVIDSNSYIYSVEGNYNKVLPLNNGFAGLIGDKWNEYYYYNDAAEGKEKVKLRTSFYGVGSNQVDIIDTWYIRLYSDEKKAGEISCTVETITDKSTVSSTQKFLISASDWDKNGFVYIRYQPQLQRGIGTSLEIESDFSIYDLQASILPDNTKQLSADYKQEYNFVDSNGI